MWNIFLFSNRREAETFNSHLFTSDEPLDDREIEQSSVIPAFKSVIPIRGAGEESACPEGNNVMPCQDSCGAAPSPSVRDDTSKKMRAENVGQIPTGEQSTKA
jgi:hypothetical protein